jgi:anti-sigma factor RsiW
MNHQSMHQLISAYADRELGHDDVIRVRQHLQSCQECAALLDEILQIKLDVHAAARIELGPSFSQRVLRVLRQDREQRDTLGSVDLFARRLVLALVVVVFFIVSVGSLNTPEQPLVIEPYLSGESADTTATRVLSAGEISKEDLLLAVSTR